MGFNRRRESTPVRVVRDTSQSVIPSQKRSEQSEETTSFDDGRIWCTHGITVKIADTEEHECHIEREEQGEESHG